MKKKPTSPFPVHCAYSELVPTEDLKPNPRNPNTHSDTQIALLSKNIQMLGWRHPIIVSTRSGFIVCGHARLKAGQKLSAPCVPVDYQDFDSDDDEMAYLIADNRIAELAEWDMSQLKDMLSDLDNDSFDMDLTGFDVDALEEIMNADKQYTKKIVPPIYEPTGECPTLPDLFDRKLTADLIAAIDRAKIPADVADFLRTAAERHTRFHFGKIAEYYCHASPKVKDLMERSGLVIIDVHKAIEYGFVHMTERLGKLLDIEEGKSDGNA